MTRMTEKQFRETLIRSGMTAASEYTPLLDRVVLVVREAGLEFAPEPVRLPEKIFSSSDVPGLREGTVCSTAPGVEYVVWKVLNGEPGGESPGLRRAISAAAVARYNAYPGLREAAISVVRLVASLVEDTDEFSALVAELAKGPKGSA